MNSLQRSWIKALRSGKYQQAHGSLKVVTPEGAKHCCLGVLCELVDPDGWDPYLEQEELPPMWNDVHSSELPNLPEAGISRHHSTPNRLYAQHLSQMNDCGNTFDEIADYLEEHLPPAPEPKDSE